VVAVSSGETKSTASRAIERVGVSSYGIYLWHWHLSIAIAALLLPAVATLPLSDGVRWALVMAVYVLSAFLFGELMEKMVGQPALKVRDRLFPATVAVFHECPAPDRELPQLNADLPSSVSIRG
jgi:peptidoglycan/LPS O-acetylase OafA/YrhL